MSIRQISVFLENKPGKLNEMTALLAAHKIDMRALSLAETEDFGIARIIVDDVFAAAGVLRDADFIAKFSEVLAFAVPDETGGLNALLSAFTEAQVNLEYMYAFLGGRTTKHAYMIFRVADPDAAEAALAARGFRALSQEDISEI